MKKRFTLKIGDNLKTPEKKLYFSGKLFAEIAPKYDFITQVLSLGQDQRWKRDLMAHLPTASDPQCLDLACGTGDLTFLLAEKYPHGRIVGLDFTEAMLELAGRRNVHANVAFSQGDMSRLTFPAESVDIVTGGYALRNAPDLEITLEGICRVLKPGGVAAFLDFSKPSNGCLQRLEYWTLKLWTGLWGLLLHGNPEVYGHIAESLQGFPDRRQLRDTLRRKGLTLVTSQLYLGGVTELLVLRKAPPSSCQPGVEP